MAITILIADDHDDNRELLQFLLTSAGYHVRAAADGKECLALAQQERPDLILMDLSMPGMDGWTVCRELQADSQTRSIPCLAVTAHAGLERQQTLETGFSGYVSKPYRATDLLQTVATVLAEGHAHSELKSQPDQAISDNVAS
jgi:CheY-like chemotaxis protein